MTSLRWPPSGHERSLEGKSSPTVALNRRAQQQPSTREMPTQYRSVVTSFRILIFQGAPGKNFHSLLMIATLSTLSRRGVTRIIRFTTAAEALYLLSARWSHFARSE